MRARDEKIAVLTCYDASFARVLDDAGVDVLLVGDSLGMVIQGRVSTLPVKLAEMSYHTRCVATGTTRAALLTHVRLYCCCVILEYGKRTLTASNGDRRSMKQSVSLAQTVQRP